jgi:hypothetical protein
VGAPRCLHVSDGPGTKALVVAAWNESQSPPSRSTV